MSLLAQAGTAAVLAMALVSLAAAAAHAQVPEGGAATPLSVWRLGLSADSMWYENALFLSETDASWSTGGRATLDWSRRFQTGTFDLGGYGGSLYYPELNSFRQATYGGHLGLNAAPSARTQFTLSQTFARTNTRQLTYDSGDIPLPTTGLYTASSGIGLTHRLSQSWQLGLHGAFEARRYDQGSLVDGEQAGVGLQLGRLVGRSSTVYLSYQFENGWFGDAWSRVHQALLGAQHHPRRGVSLDVAGGAAYLEPGGSVYPAGSARVGAGGRHVSFSLSYKRDFGQAFGYGRATIADLGGASLAWTPVTSLNFSAGYSYGYRRDPQDTAFTIRSQVASGGFNWGAPKGFSLSARYSWESNETEGYPRVEGSRVMASISYGVEWR